MRRASTASCLKTDSIEILLDTYNDDQNGYIFATTPKPGRRIRN